MNVLNEEGTDCDDNSLSQEEEGRLALLLSKAGISRYFPAFKREKVTVELIPLLQQSDFENLGVFHVGERIMLLSLAKAQEKDVRMSTELRSMFRSGPRVDNASPCSSQQSSALNSSESSSCDTSNSHTEGLMSRAERICKQLRPGKSIKSSRKNSTKPYDKRSSCKVIQKGLVLICFQGNNPGEIVALKEHEKIYDGCIRYRSDMSEDEIREEITRLVRQKESETHLLASLAPKDFDFVKCMNRRVRQIDGDTPFDGSGISQVYKNGAIYVRLNSQILQIQYEVSTDEQIIVSDDESSQLLGSTIPISFSSTKTSLVCSSVQAAESPSTSLNLDNDTNNYSSSDELQRALELSRETALLEGHVEDDDLQCESLDDVLNNLTKQIKSEQFEIIVRRGHVLVDALKIANRMSFDPTMSINVEFLGEQGYDTGGLTREFFRLVGYHASACYFEPTGCFKHNSVALQEGVYYRLGQLVAMAITHGGAAMRILCQSVFNFLSGMKPCDIIVDINEIPAAHIRDMLIQVQSVNTVEELQQILIENVDFFAECGFIRSPLRVTFSDKTDIIQSVALHFVILKTLGELTQFREGLETLGVSRAMSVHGMYLQDFYVIKKSAELTADCVRKIFKNIKFSDNGSNAREREEKTYMMFLDYLDECEKENYADINFSEYGQDTEKSNDELQSEESVDKRHVSLRMVMSFFSGADEIPVMGYLHDPELNFSPTSPYPTSSTCALQLTLPTCYSEYSPFQDAMDTALLCHGGFGLS